MKIDRATATGWLRDVAAGRWDAALSDRGGFRRAANSTVFARKVADGGGRQRIHLDLIVRPPYARDSFHLSPRCSVAFPAIAKVAAQMLGRNVGGFGKSGVVEMGLLDLIAPESPMMLFDSAERLAAFAPEIERYLTEALVPFLDQRTSVAAFTETKWREWVDNGVSPYGAGRYPLLVAAGHLVMGDARQALRTLETAYPEGSDDRKEYEDAFLVVHV